MTPTEQDVSTSDAELASAMRLARIRSAITSLAILQYLTDFSSILPLDAVSLFSDPNFDVPVLVANLLELAPWLRASPLLPTESAANLLDQASSFTTYEAQLWLILGNLLLDPGFRQRYEIDSVRRDSIMSIGEMLGSAVLKQLPHLKKLKNIVEEVALLQVEGRKVATKPMICEVGTPPTIERQREISQSPPQITPGEQALSVAGKGGEWFEKDVAPFTGYAERYVLRMAQLY